MLKLQITDAQTNQENEDEYDSPYNSKWLVAIGVCGTVVILKEPNIHFSFFDCGRCTEDVGLPESSEDEPGIYEWVCSPVFSNDWESGRDEFEGFDVISSRKIEM